MVTWPIWRVRDPERSNSWVLTSIYLDSNILKTKTSGDRLHSKGSPIGNGLWGIEWSRDWWRHLTLKSQTREPNALTVQYLENVVMLKLFRNNRWLLDSLLWSRMVGYPSNSLASCRMFRPSGPHVFIIQWVFITWHKCKASFYPSITFAAVRSSAAYILCGTAL